MRRYYLSHKVNDKLRFRYFGLGNSAREASKNIRTHIQWLMIGSTDDRYVNALNAIDAYRKTKQLPPGFSINLVDSNKLL